MAFRDVPEILRPGDVLVLNDTRVSALRVFGNKRTGGHVELLLLKRLARDEFEALARPGKRLRTGSHVELGEGMSAEILEDLGGGSKRLRFSPAEGLQERLERIGRTPLPPYIHEELRDPQRYQTVYARTEGSAAAPTAGLHFTQEILARLRAKGVELAWVTLDVGLDTFRPITSEDPLEHQIHGETCELPAETASLIARAEGRIIAVGTTAVRTLESFAAGHRRVEPGRKATSLFITPGFEFKVIDGMFTNFHLPRTTMLLMIGALAGSDRIMAAYEHAVRSRYRFLSFGDSMLIL